MNSRPVIVLALLVSTFTMFASTSDADAKSSSCHGKHATNVLPGPGSYYIDDNNAVVLGSSGKDDIDAYAANVLVCSGASDDFVRLINGGDVYLGTGNDNSGFNHGAVGYVES